MTKLSLFSSSASSRSSEGGKNKHAYHGIIQPGSFEQTDSFTEQSSCGMDLTQMEFVALPPSYSSTGNNDVSEKDGDTSSSTYGAQHLQQPQERLDSDDSSGVLDVLVFPKPRWCAGQEGKSCELPPIGIGIRGPTGWILCDETTGTIRITSSYAGYHTTIPIPSNDDDDNKSMDPHVQHGFVAPFERGGQVYTTVFANCNAHSRPVEVSGTLEFHCSPRDTTMTINGRLGGGGDGNNDYVPIPYPLVSILVFLVCFVCTFRIQCCCGNSRQSGGGSGGGGGGGGGAYQPAPQSEHLHY